MKALKLLYKIKEAYDWKVEEAIAELEELQNRSCFTCKHCDKIHSSSIHCMYFEELMPKEIGRCDKWEKQ